VSRLRIVFEVPVRTVSTLNARVHWAQRAKLAKTQRNMVRTCWIAVGQDRDGQLRVNAAQLWAARREQKPRLWITLTRLSRRNLDSDNLAGALKAVRDGVADCLGIDDGSERLTWVVQQEKTPVPNYQAVRVEIEDLS